MFGERADHGCGVPARESLSVRAAKPFLKSAGEPKTRKADPRSKQARVIAYRLQADRLGDLDDASRRLLDGSVYDRFVEFQ